MNGNSPADIGVHIILGLDGSMEFPNWKNTHICFFKLLDSSAES